MSPRSAREKGIEDSDVQVSQTREERGRREHDFGTSKPQTHCSAQVARFLFSVRLSTS